MRWVGCRLIVGVQKPVQRGSFCSEDRRTNLVCDISSRATSLSGRFALCCTLKALHLLLAKGEQAGGERAHGRELIAPALARVGPELGERTVAGALVGQ